jgi:hypothetical protein
MSDNDYFEQEAIAIGLTAAEIQAVAKRQFMASVAVACVIIIGVAVTALIPSSRNDVAAVPHKLAGVQQPTFSTPLTHGVASLKRDEIELP